MFSSNATQVSAAAGPAYIEDVFSTYLYTGNGAAQSIINNIQLGAGATSPGWILNTGSASSDAAQGIALDASGNIYVTGYSPFNKCLLIKYDSSGVVQWQRTLQVPAGGSTSVGSSVKTDSSGNVYIAGYFDDNVGDVRLLIVKYNSSGTLQWQRQLNAASADYGFGIAVDTSANVYVTGYTTVSTRTGCILAKYNSSGTIQWQRQLGGTVTSETGRSVDVDSSGNVYIAGNSSTSILIAKYNSSGVIQWQRTLGTGGPIAYGIAIDSSANIYITGNSAGATVFVVKYNTSGTLQWQRQLSPGSLSSASIALDSSANVYSIGYFSGGSAAFIAKYNTSGTFQWVRQLSGGTTNTGTAITSSGSGNLYAAGVIDSNIFVASLPNDGSGIGSYTLGSSTVTYSVAPLSDSLLSLTGATPTLTDAAASLTDSASSCTDAASSLTTSSVSLFTGSGYGGLVWIKSRSDATDHALYDTARGATFDLVSNSTAAQTTQSTGLTSFNGTGFNIGSLAKLNTSAATYASWTFRKQPKFFDIVTYTGNGANRTISHNLGSVPGCIMIKRTDTTGAWAVYHRSLANTQYIILNTAAAAATGATYWNSTTPTSSVFSLGTATDVNASGGTYVAYLFAHDAGGFGATGTDNVISCGSFTTPASGFGEVNLGYEPQFVIVKQTNGLGGWYLVDSMRGFIAEGSPNASAFLSPSTSNTENFVGVYLTSTGFKANYAASASLIYIAIRRGPMKTPTSGTSVFGLNARTGTGANATVTGGQTDDAALIKNRGAVVGDLLFSRLTGTGYLVTSGTASEVAAGATILQANPWDVMDGVKVGTTSTITNASGNTFINYLFKRAPGFFDVVCYTGTGAVLTVNHNLGVVPELMIVADRSIGQTKPVYSSALLNTEHLVLNTTAAKSSTSNVWNSTTPTATTFTLNSTPSWVNNSGDNNIAYLFATVAGVSKVGSYTGTGALLTVNCGFSAGARFVLIKRTDSTGDWYVWDSARGISSGNDPYLLLNSTAAEVTGTNYVDTTSVGFQVTAAAPAGINASGGTYIFLAIA